MVHEQARFSNIHEQECAKYALMTNGHWKFSDVNSNEEHEWRLGRHEINLNLDKRSWPPNSAKYTSLKI